MTGPVQLHIPEVVNFRHVIIITFDAIWPQPCTILILFPPFPASILPQSLAYDAVDRHEQEEHEEEAQFSELAYENTTNLLIEISISPFGYGEPPGENCEH